FTIDDGSNQRSLVRSLTATFDGLVTLQPGAIDVKIQGMTPVAVKLSQVDGGGKSIVTVQFPGAPTASGSLEDGAYTVTLHANGVTGVTLPDDIVESFHCFFGDSDGDRDVDASDFLGFRSAFIAGGPSIFNYDGDTDTDTQDF